MFSTLLSGAHLDVARAAIVYGLVSGNTSLSREISPLTAAVGSLALDVIEKCILHSLPTLPERGAYRDYLRGRCTILIHVLSLSALITHMSPAKALIIMGLHRCVFGCFMGSIFVGRYFTRNAP